MSAGKPRPPVSAKPTIPKICTPPGPTLANPTRSVSEMKKVLEGKLSFPDFRKKKVTYSQSADVQPHAPAVFHHTGGASRANSMHDGQEKKDTVTPGNGIDTIGASRSHIIHSGQWKKDTVNPDDGIDTGGASRSHIIHNEQGKKDTVNPGNGIETGGPSCSPTICNGQGKKDTLTPGNGIESDRRSSGHKGTCRVAPQRPARVSSGSVKVDEKEANQKNAKQIVEMMDKAGQNLEVSG